MRSISKGVLMSKKRKKTDSPQDKLKLEKTALDPSLDEDLPIEEKEAADIQGGFAPPYVPLGPVVGGDNIRRP
jgi:hypothetical protein